MRFKTVATIHIPSVCHRRYACTTDPPSLYLNSAATIQYPRHAAGRDSALRCPHPARTPQRGVPTMQIESVRHRRNRRMANLPASQPISSERDFPKCNRLSPDDFHRGANDVRRNLAATRCRSPWLSIVSIRSQRLGSFYRKAGTKPARAGDPASAKTDAATTKMCFDDGAQFQICVWRFRGWRADSHRRFRRLNVAPWLHTRSDHNQNAAGN